jgi:hypothetical protein
MRHGETTQNTISTDPVERATETAKKVMPGIVLAADADLAALEALIEYFKAQFKIKPWRIMIDKNIAYGFHVKYIPCETLSPTTVTTLTSRADGFIAGWKARET